MYKKTKILILLITCLSILSCTKNDDKIDDNLFKKNLDLKLKSDIDFKSISSKNLNFSKLLFKN